MRIRIQAFGNECRSGSWIEAKKYFLSNFFKHLSDLRNLKTVIQNVDILNFTKVGIFF